MTIYLFKNKGLVPSLIKFQTRSQYTHAAIEIDGFLYESVFKGVVKTELSAALEHYKKVKYDKFECIWPALENNKKEVKNFLEMQVGKKYDFTMLFRFLTREQATRKSKNRWFCSELVFAAINKFVPILKNIEPWAVSPGMISYSPYLRKVVDKKVGKI